MNFRLETMVNTYNAKSKAYLYQKWDSVGNVIFNLTTTNNSTTIKGIEE